MKYGYEVDDVHRDYKRFDNFNAFTEFPGAQPISLDKKNLYELQRHQTLVCEKTDGMRYLLAEAVNIKGIVFWCLINRRYSV